MEEFPCFLLLLLRGIIKKKTFFPVLHCFHFDILLKKKSLAGGASACAVVARPLGADGSIGRSEPRGNPAATRRLAARRPPANRASFTTAAAASLATGPGVAHANARCARPREKLDPLLIHPRGRQKKSFEIKRIRLHSHEHNVPTIVDGTAVAHRVNIGVLV